MNKRNSIILGLLFVILVVEIIIIAPKEIGIVPPEETKVDDPIPAEPASGQLMKGVYLVETNSDGREWELWADKAKTLQPGETSDWWIEQVRVKFFANNGVTYVVTGQKGNVVPDKNDIRIEGDVVTRSSNGYVFETESVFYDSKSRKLLSPQDVAMTGPKDETGDRLRLTGTDMIADLATNEISVNRNVRARKRVKDDQVATIRSQRALFSGRTNLAEFFGNVIIEMETMQITGPEARFAYDSKSEQLESVVVGGGVRVTDTDKFATSNSVAVHFKKERVVFKGAPRVVQNGDELVGDEIIFLDGGRKVQVHNAKAELDPSSMEQRQ